MKKQEKLRKRWEFICLSSLGLGGFSFALIKIYNISNWSLVICGIIFIVSLLKTLKIEKELELKKKTSESN